MIVRKAFKFRIDPNVQQQRLLAQNAGCCRLVWNRALALQHEKLAKKERVYSYNDLAGLLTVWKKNKELSFLKEVHSQPLQQVLKDFDRAFKDGLTKKKGMPVFKKKNVSKEAMKFPQGYRFSGRKIFIPKIGLVKTYQGRPIQGEMKNLTVCKEAGLWYASIQVEQDVLDPVHANMDSMIGIDLGVKRFATLSNGKVIEPISVYRKYQGHLAKQQRSLSRKSKGSKNKEKARRKVQSLHEKIRRIRQDFLHKASHWVAKNHGCVVLEDLHIKNMSKSASGSVESPGKMVQQKSGLNKSILDQGWYEFKRQLQYKLDWLGGELHVVPAAYTSQTCSMCEHVDAENRKSQSRFVCVHCGFEANADENAARNIERKALGHRVLACESNR